VPVLFISQVTPAPDCASASRRQSRRGFRFPRRSCTAPQQKMVKKENGTRRSLTAPPAGSIMRAEMRSFLRPGRAGRRRRMLAAEPRRASRSRRSLQHRRERRPRRPPVTRRTAVLFLRRTAEPARPCPRNPSERRGPTSVAPSLRRELPIDARGSRHLLLKILRQIMFKITWLLVTFGIIWGHRGPQTWCATQRWHAPRRAEYEISVEPPTALRLVRSARGKAP
jgi:hypothetical protein